MFCRRAQQEFYEAQYLPNGVFQAAFLCMKYNRRGRKDPRLLLLSTEALWAMSLGRDPSVALTFLSPQEYYPHHDGPVRHKRRKWKGQSEVGLHRRSTGVPLFSLE